MTDKPREDFENVWINNWDKCSVKDLRVNALICFNDQEQEEWTKYIKYSTYKESERKLDKVFHEALKIKNAHELFIKFQDSMYAAAIDRATNSILEEITGDER